jgi:hypothetical protein
MPLKLENLSRVVKEYDNTLFVQIQNWFKPELESKKKKRVNSAGTSDYVMCTGVSHSNYYKDLSRDQHRYTMQSDVTGMSGFKSNRSKATFASRIFGSKKNKAADLEKSKHSKFDKTSIRSKR